MLNKRKIRLMAKTAIYEQGKGKEDVNINSYGGSDYVRFNMIKTIIGATIAAFLIFGLVVLYKMEDVMSDIMHMDFIGIGRQVAFLYLIFIAVYAVVSLIVYQQRYYKASRRLKKYKLNLQKIESISRHEAKKRY